MQSVCPYKKSDLTKSQSELNNLLNDIQQRIHKLPTEFPDPIIQKIETISPPGAVKESQTPEEVEGAALDEISIDQLYANRQKNLKYE